MLSIVFDQKIAVSHSRFSINGQTFLTKVGGFIGVGRTSLWILISLLGAPQVTSFISNFRDYAKWEISLHLPNFKTFSLCARWRALPCGGSALLRCKQEGQEKLRNPWDNLNNCQIKIHFSDLNSWIRRPMHNMNYLTLLFFNRREFFLCKYIDSLFQDLVSSLSILLKESSWHWGEY